MELFLLKLLLFFICIKDYSSLKCGFNEIEGCSKCQEDNNSNKCLLCEDGYTLVLDGANCLKCDDELLGSKGCSGNCQLDKSNRLVKCEENSCKEGFYEISPGYCAICSFLSNHCLKCSYSYLDDNQEEEKVFKCLECEPHYYISNGTCVYFSEGCKNPLNENTCLECEENYFLDKRGYCRKNDDYYCIKAEYDPIKDIVSCLECKEQYFFDGYSCKYCNQQYKEYENQIYKCAKCKIIYSNRLKCEKALDGYYVTEYGGTNSCPDLCKKCGYYKEDNSQDSVLKCDECI